MVMMTGGDGGGGNDGGDGGDGSGRGVCVESYRGCSAKWAHVGGGRTSLRAHGCC